MGKEKASGFRSSMKEWLKWVLRLFLVGLIGVIAYSLYLYRVAMLLSRSEVQKVESAIARGIVIEDEQDDFVMMATNKEILNAEDNPSPYRLSFLDVKSLTLAADEQYLYAKITFFDVIPERPTSVEGDAIRAIGCKVNIVDENNMDQMIFAMDTSYLPIVDLPSLNTYYFYEPTGIQEPESARFAHQDHKSKIDGGAGTDYILAAFPLEKLNLRIGQRVLMSLSVEAKSDRYTHAAVDVLLGSGKMPAIIQWIIGENTYQLIDLQKNGSE
jgi:hypothetical protein